MMGWNLLKMWARIKRSSFNWRCWELGGHQNHNSNTVLWVSCLVDLSRMLGNTDQAPVHIDYCNWASAFTFDRVKRIKEVVYRQLTSSPKGSIGLSFAWKHGGFESCCHCIQIHTNTYLLFFTLRIFYLLLRVCARVRPRTCTHSCQSVHEEVRG